ncbi:hypothetical protein GCM10011409_35180 [Lentibacillus populi]|uniref:SAF domain-containing protein n=1 Tax=Lentibacillus populi TaxID=1827502 RepID=A0A9W5TZV6_9BACI|nr:UxaA family hydrolase [Lentibacillus populi]GGB54536.1 hypothetical protein GCM10011409_35180 [Lentibacillus populi]
MVKGAGSYVKSKESETTTPVSRHRFLIHNKEDHVGVATTPIEEDEQVIGVYMEDNSEVNIRANKAIPLGHKISLVELDAEQPIIKYGIQIGITTCALHVGDYVHTHNIKTARW